MEKVNIYYDLEVRTFEYAKNVRKFIRILPKSLSNFEDAKQLIRSSGSIAANYIEAIEGFSDKDYLYRIKVCRKESKESLLWLKLIDSSDSEILENERCSLIRESVELMNIFGSIIRKKEAKCISE